jgi:hypothetical protein
MKIYAISGTDSTATSSTAYLVWASIAAVTAAIFIATLRIRGERGAS